jgi:hypothetical protein
LKLKKKAEPSDLNKAHKIDGVDWWYCKKHKWCRHKNTDCKGINRSPDNNPASGDDANGGQSAATQPTVNPGGGDRAGRTLRAVGAVAAE